MTEPCPHLLRIWIAHGGSASRPWDVRYIPRDAPCAVAPPHLEHRTASGRTWR